MIISIADLKNDIIERFSDEIASIYFGIESVIFEGKSEKLIIIIRHYKNQNLIYKLMFEDIYSYRVTQESLITYFNDENFEGFSFFEYANISRLKADIVQNHSLGFILGEDKDILAKIISYRLVGQNSFIDILTAKIPIIEILEI